MTRTPQSGFTFLEVMIAVAVIAIAVVTLIGSQSQSVSTVTGSRENIMASLLAQKKLSQLESSGFDELYSEEGDFEDSDAGLRWQTEVNTLSSDDIGIVGADDMLKTIDLNIIQGGSNRVVYSVRSIVMKKIVPEEK